MLIYPSWLLFSFVLSIWHWYGFDPFLLFILILILIQIAAGGCMLLKGLKDPPLYHGKDIDLSTFIDGMWLVSALNNFMFN